MTLFKFPISEQEVIAQIQTMNPAQMAELMYTKPFNIIFKKTLLQRVKQFSFQELREFSELRKPKAETRKTRMAQFQAEVEADKKRRGVA